MSKTKTGVATANALQLLDVTPRKTRHSIRDHGKQTFAFGAANPLGHASDAVQAALVDSEVLGQLANGIVSHPGGRLADSVNLVANGKAYPYFSEPCFREQRSNAIGSARPG